ncbi:bacterioferritin [Psychrobium sp. 1_MG-2023]|uniref:bacterioferritin n=1 Tax=Psychrobium sp. 1_MG-2023 TaxID=3062624 RepID=UPI000C3413A2|nr:bacterioferritin [Psychrobium sp. 1_MG-2023]MDP2559693.1 bacterioferritin [Psychrobium sp. 1_MG-2023]PKF59524.1 bacterioferritin [Alteromonadales bacterium alter-6D02]
MKANSDIVKQLNRVLTVELTSINQFFLHARIFKNWGLEALNHKAYKKSIKDMKQADKLIERILFLEGLPNLQQLGRLRIGEHTQEMLECDLHCQNDQNQLMAEVIQACEDANDYVSRDILVEILDYEQEYIDWLEAQLDLIKGMGVENYQQAMMDK